MKQLAIELRQCGMLDMHALETEMEMILAWGLKETLTLPERQPRRLRHSQPPEASTLLPHISFYLHSVCLNSIIVKPRTSASWFPNHR